MAGLIEVRFSYLLHHSICCTIICQEASGKLNSILMRESDQIKANNVLCLKMFDLVHLKGF